MKRFSVFFFVICLLSGATLVLASHNGLPPVGWTSGQQIQNIGSEVADVYLVAYNALGDRYTCPEKQLNFGESHTYLSDEGNPMEVCVSDDVGTGDMLTLPSGYSGSGVVFGTQPLAGIINIHNKGFGRADGTEPKRFFHYACFNAGNASTSISLPLVKEHFFGNTSGIQVQNTGTISTHLILTYTTGAVAGGNIGNLTYVISTTKPVGPGSSKTFWNITGGGTLNIVINYTSPATNTVPLMRSNNGVIVKSVPWQGNTAQPIVAIAIESTENSANPQDSEAYEGGTVEGVSG
jgi:hypothetical protein